MSHKLFDKLIGRWEGICRTWFQPGQLADESAVSGELTEVLDGRFLRHTYEGSIQGKMRRGEELIAFNPVTNTFQSSWVDDFHMHYAIMFCRNTEVVFPSFLRGSVAVIRVVLVTASCGPT